MSVQETGGLSAYCDLLRGLTAGFIDGFVSGFNASRSAAAVPYHAASGLSHAPAPPRPPLFSLPAARTRPPPRVAAHRFPFAAGFAKSYRDARLRGKLQGAQSRRRAAEVELLADAPRAAARELEALTFADGAGSTELLATSTAPRPPSPPPPPPPPEPPAPPPVQEARVASDLTVMSMHPFELDRALLRQLSLEPGGRQPGLGGPPYRIGATQLELPARAGPRGYSDTNPDFEVDVIP